MTAKKSIQKKGYKVSAPLPEDMPDSSWTSRSWDEAPNKALLLSYLLWYFSNSSSFPSKSQDSNFKQRVNTYLLNMGLISIDQDQDQDDEEEYFTLTEKGHVMVLHLMSQPLPVASTTWAMPKPEDF